MSVRTITHAFPKPEGKKIVRLKGDEQMKVVLFVTQLDQSGRLAEMELADIHGEIERHLAKWVSPDAVRSLLNNNPAWKWKRKEPPPPPPVPAPTDEIPQELRAMMEGIQTTLAEIASAIPARVSEVERSIRVLDTRLTAVGSDREMDGVKLNGILKRLERIENATIPPDNVSGRKV